MPPGMRNLWVSGMTLLVFGTCSVLIISKALAAGEDGDISSAAQGHLTKKPENGVSSKEQPAGWKSLSRIFELSGGISAGEFYASHAGPNAWEDELLLSNFLLQVSTRDENLPISFTAAFGETSTPSLLDPPERNNQFEGQYASVAIKPVSGLSFEGGLLTPCSGYEDTYTYNNPNIVLGIVASQQPYNGYGGRVTYSLDRLTLHAGYYPKRLDREEYGMEGSLAGDAWELALTGSAFDFSFSLYNYHVNGIRNLTGGVIEHDLNNIHFALNLDVWKWDGEISHRYQDSTAIGAAFYIIPTFGRFSVPVRLEWVDQGGSEIYLENPDTHILNSVTISPTYRFTDKVYVRMESSYACGDNAFTSQEGRAEDGRVYLSAEVGYVF